MAEQPASLLNAFGDGLAFADYHAAMKTLQRHMAEQFEAISIPDELRAEFSGLVQPRGRVLTLVMTEDHCPDSVLNLSIVARLAEAVPGLELRVVHRDEYKSLADRYPTPDGYNHIPTVIFFTPDGTELGVWHERPAAAHAFLADYERDHPKPPVEDGKKTPAFKTWFKERLAVQKQNYRRGMWRETVNELMALLK
ncbi:MAG: thioredoxin family protein [Anaerolineae bacterium]